MLANVMAIASGAGFTGDTKGLKRLARTLDGKGARKGGSGRLPEELETGLLKLVRSQQVAVERGESKRVKVR